MIDRAGWDTVDDPELPRQQIAVTNGDKGAMLIASTYDLHHYSLMYPGFVNKRSVGGQMVGEFDDLDAAVNAAHEILEGEIDHG